MRRSVDRPFVGPAGAYLGRLIDHLRTPLYGGAYALILSSGSTSVLGMVYWTLAARLYEPSAVGVNAAVISSMTFLSYLAQLNMSGALSRFTPTAGRATRRLIGSAYLAAGGLSAVAALVFLAGVQHWAPEASGLVASAPIALWFVVGTVAWSIFALEDGVLTGLRQTIWVPINNTIFALAKIVLLAMFATEVFQFGIFASWTIPAALLILPVNLLIFVRFLPRHVAARSARVMEAGTRQIVRYLVGDYVGSLLVNASVSLLPLIVLASLGADASAYFYIGWTIAYSLQLMSMNIATSLMVEGAARRETLETDSRRALVLLLRLQVPLVLGVFAFAGFILRIFGEGYQDQSEGLLRILTLAVLPHGVNAIFLSVARVRRQVGRIVVIQGALAGLSLSLSWLLLGPLGIRGVGVAWLLAQTMVASVLLLIGLRSMWGAHGQVGDELPYSRTALAQLVQRAGRVTADGVAGPGPAALAGTSELATLFGSLEADRIEWSLLRDGRAVPGDDTDILINRDDLPAVRSVLHERGYIELTSRGRGSHRFFRTLDPETGLFVDLDVVTELSFGRFFELRTDLASGALARRQRRGEAVALDPDDAFWGLLLHCLVDKRTISPTRAADLQALSMQASADRPFGLFVGALLPAPWDAVRMLAAARRGEWVSIERAGPSIASRWRRRDAMGTTWRSLSGALGRGIEVVAKIRRGGLTVALLGLDGAGKSTVADGLATSYGTRVRLVYMGLWKRGDGPASPRLAPFGIALRPIRTWVRYLMGQIYRASGSVVIFDRYTYDAAIPPRGRFSTLKRIYFWGLAHAIPGPDLTVLLDAPIEVLDARKPEAAAADRSRDAAALRQMVGRLSSAVVIDANRSSDAVLADVTSKIWSVQAARWDEIPPDRGSGLVRRFDRAVLAPVAMGRRRIISARAARTPTELSAVMSELRRQGILQAEAVRAVTVTDTGVKIAWMAEGASPPSLLLKVGQPGHDQALLAHAAAVDRLRSDDRLIELRPSLPRIRSFGRLEDVAYVVEEPLPGIRGDRLLRDRNVRATFLVGAADWIGTLHRQTSVRDVVDERLIEGWIDRPEAAIATVLVGRNDARRRLRALARLTEDLREDLSGRQVDIGWIHGDYWAGNILASEDGARILGVIDWDLAGDAELPLDDILHLILYARRLNGDLELGEIVASALRRPDWEPAERLILERCSLGWPFDPDGARRAIALSWLRHVGAFAGDGSHGSNRIWLRRNVDPVLDHG